MPEYQCPNGCQPEVDTPFFYPACCLPYPCQGVLVYPDLRVSNRWCDGVAGVPQDIADFLTEHDCLPHCVECGEEIIEKP
jgi:hypothetical protein